MNKAFYMNLCANMSQIASKVLVYTDFIWCIYKQAHAVTDTIGALNYMQF